MRAREKSESRRRTDLAPGAAGGRDAARSGRFRARRRSRAGFTLLEILISLLILIIALTSVFALFGAASAAHRRAVASQNAAQLAYCVLAELSQVPNPGALTNMTGKTNPAFEGYTYDVAFSTAGPNEIQAVVTVRWKKAGKDEAEVYTTILLKR